MWKIYVMQRLMEYYLFHYLGEDSGTAPWGGLSP